MAGSALEATADASVASFPLTLMVVAPLEVDAEGAAGAVKEPSSGSWGMKAGALSCRAHVAPRHIVVGPRMRGRAEESCVQDRAPCPSKDLVDEPEAQVCLTDEENA